MKNAALTTLGISLLLLSACATTTTIHSDPDGAVVSHRGQEIGVTPMDYRSTDPIWSSRKLEISSAGHETYRLHLERTEMNTVYALISGGIFLFTGCIPASVAVFLAGGMDYPDEHHVRLRPLRHRRRAATNRDATEAAKESTRQPRRADYDY